MGLGYTSAELASLDKRSSVVKMLISVELGSLDWKFCTGRDAIRFDSVAYTPIPMKIDSSSSGSAVVSRMNIHIDNLSGVRGSEIDGEGGLNGAAFVASIITLDNGVWGNEIVILTGEVVRCNIVSVIKIEASGKAPGSRLLGLGKGSFSCLYTHKGPLCGDASAGNCSGTYAECVNRSNEAHFGGFRFSLQPGEAIMVEGPPIPFSSRLPQEDSRWADPSTEMPYPSPSGAGDPWYDYGPHLPDGRRPDTGSSGTVGGPGSGDEEESGDHG